MDEQMRVQLETGTRVLDFSRANPSDNPGQEAAVKRLEEALALAKGQMDQEVSGVQAVHGSVVARESVRDELVSMGRVLLGVARSAQAELPASAVSFRLRGGKSSAMLFTVQAQAALAAGLTHRGVLEKYGLAPGFLDEFKALIGQFEASQGATNAGRRAHVGAHASLEALVVEIMQIVRQLDALNQHRFKKDAERRGAWRNARDVHWPGGQAAKAAAKPAGGERSEPAA